MINNSDSLKLKFSEGSTHYLRDTNESHAIYYE